jgi:hypothetical protein
VLRELTETDGANDNTETLAAAVRQALATAATSSEMRDIVEREKVG